MDVFEFVDPLRKRKITNNLFDFDKYVYKEKVDESEEKKSDDPVKYSSTEKTESENRQKEVAKLGGKGLPNSEADLLVQDAP
ncbi:SNF2 family protein, putative [Plasmodium ovale curtisi]|uniref:SNF2 family protein, putative n=1 Tax=Plasmodium ovale curtisi TaxID=864141 RepID=A0A1A8WQW2_PLAOA|nr:SNF2 family protein, putative [Plasmodium ovale curtisi]